VKCVRPLDTVGEQGALAALAPVLRQRRGEAEVPDPVLDIEARGCRGLVAVDCEPALPAARVRLSGPGHDRVREPVTGGDDPPEVHRLLLAHTREPQRRLGCRQRLEVAPERHPPPAGLEAARPQPVRQLCWPRLRRNRDVAAHVAAHGRESLVEQLLGRGLVDAEACDLVQHRAPRSRLRPQHGDAAEVDRVGVEAAVRRYRDAVLTLHRRREDRTTREAEVGRRPSQREDREGERHGRHRGAGGTRRRSRGRGGGRPGDGAVRATYGEGACRFRQ